MVLQSASEVIDVLGGIPAVMKLTSSNYKAVWVWQDSGKFPAKTFVLLQNALQHNGYEAPAHLWGMSEDVA